MQHFAWYKVVELVMNADFTQRVVEFVDFLDDEHVARLELEDDIICVDFIREGTPEEIATRIANDAAYAAAVDDGFPF